MPQNPAEILKQYFGYTEFRQGQAEIIDRILGGRDALGIMPTGAGKSVCFQVPALASGGITLVVSPLISLMKDQVTALVQSGVRGAYMNSSLSPAQYREVLRRARAGTYKIIYVAPERLLTGAFMSFARAVDVSLFAVDEAHCVSQWGQDFRPSYLRIAEFIECLPKRPVMAAFTATATSEVREDIVNMLGLCDPYVAVTGFNRANLYFSVQKPVDKYQALLDILGKHSGKSGIIYCLTRKAVEEVCGRLNEDGYSAARYHAGLADEERRGNQDDFINDRKPLMVATNAFGMGIDKSNVSFVVHYNMPKNLESYYQEAGRAGRDGADAECSLLYSGRDFRTNMFLIEHSEKRDDVPDKVRAEIMARDIRRLKIMTAYCHTDDCLREFILRYFGERAPADCGFCENCRIRSRDRANAELRAESGELSTGDDFSAGSDAFTADSGEPVAGSGARGAAGPLRDSEMLFERLKWLRFRLASEQHIPAYAVFSNATLLDMCKRLPADEDELLEVSGVAQIKCQKYGSLFLEAIQDYLAEQ